MNYQHLFIFLVFALMVFTIRADIETNYEADLENPELLSLEQIAHFSNEYFNARLAEIEADKKDHSGPLGHRCSVYGVDVYSHISPSGASCLFNRGFRFSIHRAFQSNNRIDPNAPQSIINARNAGFKYIDIYMFPNMYESPTSQIKRLVESLRQNNVKYGMLWLDIENFDWPKDKQRNRNFVNELIRAAGTYTGHALGIYSNKNNWNQITGLDFHLNPSLPLWYAHYDNWHSFDDYVPFASFKKPDIKQYVGDKMVCGIDIDENSSDNKKNLQNDGIPCISSDTLALFIFYLGIPPFGGQATRPIEEILSPLDELWEEYLPSNILDLVQHGHHALSYPPELLSHPELARVFQDLHTASCLPDDVPLEDIIAGGAPKHIRILLGCDISAIPDAILNQALAVLTNLLNAPSADLQKVLDQGAVEMLSSVLSSPHAKASSLSLVFESLGCVIRDDQHTGRMLLKELQGFFTQQLPALVDHYCKDGGEHITCPSEWDVVYKGVFCMASICQLPFQSTEVDCKHDPHFIVLAASLQSVAKYADLLIHFNDSGRKGSSYLQTINRDDFTVMDLGTLDILIGIADAITRFEHDLPEFNSKLDPISPFFLSKEFNDIMHQLFLRFDEDAKALKRPSTLLAQSIKLLASLTIISSPRFAQSTLTHEIVPWALSLFIKGGLDAKYTIPPPSVYRDILFMMSNYIPSVKQANHVTILLNTKVFESVVYTFDNPLYKTIWHGKDVKELMWMITNIVSECLDDHRRLPIFEPIVLSPMFLQIIYQLASHPCYMIGSVPYSDQNRNQKEMYELLSRYLNVLKMLWDLYKDSSPSVPKATKRRILQTLLPGLTVLFINMCHKLGVITFDGNGSNGDGDSNHDNSANNQQQDEFPSDFSFTLSFTLPYGINNDHDSNNPDGSQDTTLTCELALQKLAFLTKPLAEYIHYCRYQDILILQTFDDYY